MRDRVAGARVHRQCRRRRRRGVEVDAARAALAFADGHAAEALERGEELVHLDEDVRRRQHRPAPVVAELVVTVARLLPELLGGAVHVVQLEHQAVVGQEVEQGVEAVEEQWQVILDAGRRQPLADVPVHRARGGIALEPRPPAFAENTHRVLGQRELARRQQADALHPARGALALRVEAADGVHLVVQQVDADGRVRAHGEEVQQRAAHGELAVLHDLPDAAVAGGVQPFTHGRQVQPVALGEHQPGALHVAPRAQPRQQGRHRHDEHAALDGGQPVQRGEALGDDVLVRREGVVGQRLPVGEVHHGGAAGAGVEEDLALHARRRRRIGGDDDDDAVVTCRGLGHRQATCTAGEAAPGTPLAARAWQRVGKLWQHAGGWGQAGLRRAVASRQV